MTLTIVSDLFLTDSFLIKGEVERKYNRLSQMLDEHRKYFLKVRNATLVDLWSADRQAPSITARLCRRFPTLEVLEPVALRWETAAPIAPLRVAMAVIPPGSDEPAGGQQGRDSTAAGCPRGRSKT
jgi:hypothetical protein